MSDNVDTRVTPALHPDTVKAIEDYDSDTEAVLAPTVTAFSEAYIGISQVHDVRDASKRNPTWNPAQALIHTDDAALKKIDRIARNFDSVRVNLEKDIAHIEQELTAPVQSKAAQSISAEIRAHVKGMNTTERRAFIQQAIDDGDELSATALLGAPAYLSGLDPNMQKVFVRFYRERTEPGKAKRLRAMVAAKEMIEKNAPLLFPEMAKAVGFITDPKTQRKYYAKELRDQKLSVEKLFSERGA